MHMRQPVSRTAANTLAFLIGAGAGMALGILFAPRAGRETRLRLRQKAEDARDKVESGIQKEKDMVGDVIDTAKQAVHEGKEALRDKNTIPRGT